MGRKDELSCVAGILKRGKIALLCSSPGVVGVGRLSIALEYARLHRDAFPDGVFYAPGESFDPYLLALRLARYLDVPADHIGPEGGAGRAFEALLVGKRILLVLGEVQDARLLKLLPPSGPLVIAACRDETVARGLDAGVVTVKRFSATEADLLLEATLGSERWGMEASSAREIASLLSCHPLAMAVALGSVLERVHSSGPVVSYLVRSIRNRLNRLQRFSGESRWTGAAFACSIERMDSEQRTFLHALGCLPTQGFSVEAAAVVGQVSRETSAMLLDRLTHLALVRGLSDSRYALHSLIGDLARGLGSTLDAQAHAANYYLGFTLSNAEYPSVLDTEMEGILDGMAFVTEQGDAHRVKDFALALGPYFDVRGYKEEVLRRLQWGLAAARASQDRRSEGRISRWLGRMFLRRNALEAARDRITAASDLAEAAEDPQGQVQALFELGQLEMEEGRLEAAAQSLYRCLKLAGVRYREKGEAQLLLVEVLAQTGDLKQALEVLDDCEQWAKTRMEGGLLKRVLLLREEILPRLAPGEPLEDEVNQVVQELGDAAKGPHLEAHGLEDSLPTGPGEELDQALILEPPQNMKALVETSLPDQTIQVLAEKAADDRSSEQLDALEALAAVQIKRGESVAAERSLVDGARLAEARGGRGRAAGFLEQSGKLNLALGNISTALQHYERCFRLREETGDNGAATKTLHTMGRVATEAGDYDAAMYHFLRGLDRQERIADDSGRAEALFRLGIIYSARGDYADALAHYEVSEELWLAARNLPGLAAVLLAKGRIQVQLGRPKLGADLYQRACELAEALGDERLKASALHQLGVLAVDTGDYQDGMKHYQRSLSLKRNAGDLRGMAVTLHAMARLEAAKGKATAAREHYKRVLEIADGLGANRVRAATLRALGDVQVADGELQDAERSYEEAASLQAVLGEKGEIAALNHGIGTIKAEQGDFEGAVKHFRHSLKLSRDLKDRRGAADTLYQLGVVLAESGHDAESILHLEKSLKLDERLNNLRGVAVSKAMLGQVLVLVKQYERARTVFEEALGTMEQEGMPEAVTVRQWLDEGF